MSRLFCESKPVWLVARRAGIRRDDRRLRRCEDWQSRGRHEQSKEQRGKSTAQQKRRHTSNKKDKTEMGNKKHHDITTRAILNLIRWAFCSALKK